MNKIPKVLVFDTFSRTGGGLAYYVNIAHALSGSKHNWDWNFYCNPAIKGLVNDLEETANVYYGPEFLRYGGLEGYIHRKSILKDAISKIKPDVVIAMNQLDFRVKIPSILFLQNLLYFELGNSCLRKKFPLIEIIRCFVLYRASLKSIKRADCIVTSTAAFMDAIVNKHFKVKTKKNKVIPFGANHTTATEGSHDYKRNPKEILFLQYNFYKGLDIALLALKKMVTDGYDVHLTVTDTIDNHNTKNARKIVSMVQELSLDAHVSFIGNVKQKKLKDLYSNCDVFWFPSFIESFGYGLLEAMANGVPCVASDIGAFREIGSDCVSYFPVGDHVILAQTTSKLFDNVKIREKMGNDSREHAKEYTWSKHVSTMETVLQDICRKTN